MRFFFREDAATKTAGVELLCHFGGTYTVALDDGQESLLDSRLFKAFVQSPLCKNNIVGQNRNVYKTTRTGSRLIRNFRDRES